MKYKKLSVIIPVYNERENIQILCDQLRSSLAEFGAKYEVIFIDDGSTDGSDTILEQIALKYNNFKYIIFRRNFGQTAALMAGFEYSSGDIIVPMDGDLQNDPSDIKKLIEKLDEGFDVVSGWRMDRKDHPIKRNIPSRIANSLISIISGVSLHDYGCSLKAYRRDVVKDIKLYGEMHRFVPIYATWSGAKVTEVAVRHYPRQYGESKYGLERVAKVVLDLIVVKFLAKYSTKPIYVFGGFGMLTIAFAIILTMTALYLKLFKGVSFILTPIPLLAVTAFLSGFMSILMGLLAEIVVRTYYESQGKSIYVVKHKKIN